MASSATAAPTRLLLATTNPDKVREIRALLDGAPIVLHSLAELPPTAEPEETGVTFAENARLKAAAYDRHARVSGTLVEPFLTVAEDSGLEVDAMDREPGVYSARFVRPDASYPERFAEIYRRLAARPDAPRTARFVCAVAIVDGAGPVFETAGVVEGEIAPKPGGTAGFGYDPIFYFPAYGRTLAEVTQAEKLAVAHRGRAFREVREWLLRGGPAQVRATRV